MRWGSYSLPVDKLFFFLNDCAGILSCQAGLSEGARSLSPRRASPVQRTEIRQGHRHLSPRLQLMNIGVESTYN